MTSLLDARREPLTEAGRRYVIRDHLSIPIQVGLALAAAGTLSWYNAWVYAAAFLVVKTGSALILMQAQQAARPKSRIGDTDQKPQHGQ